MVKNHFLLALISATLIFVMFVNVATAQRVYHFNQEWVKIWINQDGTIDLFYSISITLVSGDPINWVRVGQPREEFTTILAKDQYNRTLTTSDLKSGNDYKVQVNFFTTLSEGQTIWFTLLTRVAHMIHEDTQNPGNVGMQFVPTWYDAEIRDLRVAIVLPAGVTMQNVKTSVSFDNSFTESDGRLTVYWERRNLSPNEKYTFGVSFPKQYIQHYDTQPSGLIAFFQKYGIALFMLGFLAIFIGAVFVAVRKKPYLTPRISMETLGIRRGLTAVEASYLLGMEPTKIVTEILYSLLQKRAVWVESTNPSLKLRVMQSYQNTNASSENSLRYYEIEFLKAIRKDGTLDEEKLAETVMYLRETVEQKMRGYCRRDTIDYYKKIVAKAWEQVEQAGTPDLASKAYDEQLLWLLLDPNYKSRTENVFRDRAFEPSPFWLWYWYSYQHYYPSPTYKPNIENPAQSTKPPTIPGADFANNIATAIEKTSNNIVANLEKFANSILPMPEAQTSTEPAREGATCVCACAACACVCACVSCACACASGGVG